MKKRQVLTYDQFLKTGEKAENAKGIEKGEADLVKKAMSGEKEGKKGIAVLDESEIKDNLTNKEIWDNWTPEERQKFLDEHFKKIHIHALQNIIKSNYDNLWKWWDIKIKDELDKYISNQNK